MYTNGNLAKKYDLGFTHIVQASGETMKRLIACDPEEININDYEGKKDIYYTPNTFNSPIKRDVNYLWQLHRFYIDIDHKEGTLPIDHYEIVMQVEELVQANKIPAPTEYVNSGRGIHIYWDINNCHIMLLDLWEKIENQLFNSIKELEKTIKNIKVDKRATDPTRLLRLYGSINSKSNTKCYSMLRNEDNIYNIFDLKKQYIKVNKPKKKSNKSVVFLPTKNLYTLNMSRMEDFKTIVSLRKGDVEGYRNTLIMMYSYHYRLVNEVTVEELIKEVREYNKSFSEPYKIKDLKAVCRSVTRVVKHFKEDENKGYKFTNRYIIDSLDITPKEQRKLLTIISVEEKYRRNNERRTPRNEKGLTNKQAELQELKTKVLELKESGLSNVKIAEKLGTNESKIRRVLKL